MQTLIYRVYQVGDDELGESQATRYASQELKEEHAKLKENLVSLTFLERIERLFYKVFCLRYLKKFNRVNEKIPKLVERYSKL